MALNFWNWNWSYVCPTGLTPWQADDQFLSPCFQEICLQLPTLFMFAMSSAYYFGNQTVLIRRNRIQNFLISIRILVSFLIILLQFYSMFQMIVTRAQIWPIDVLLMGFQIVTWSIHIGTYTFLHNFIAESKLFVSSFNRLFVSAKKSWRFESSWAIIHCSDMDRTSITVMYYTSHGYFNQKVGDCCNFSCITCYLFSNTHRTRIINLYAKASPRKRCKFNP